MYIIFHTHKYICTGTYNRFIKSTTYEYVLHLYMSDHKLLVCDDYLVKISFTIDTPSFIVKIHSSSFS